MVIKYLGTAAAEGMPAIFCRCELCEKARKSGGKNIRTRNQICIDGDTLVDFPMDSYMHALNYGIDLSAVGNVFITHAHMDHCYPQDVTMRGAPFAHNMTKPIINFYGNASVIKKFKEHTRDELKPEAEKSIRLHTLKPYDVVNAGGMKVTALPARHTIGEDCLLYAIEKGGKTALVMNDTGVLDESVYEYLESRNTRFDFISFDCTYGGGGGEVRRHMGLVDNISERERMKAHSLVKDGTVYVITHFSHNSGLLHEELSALAEKNGMIAAFDGMELNI